MMVAVENARAASPDNTAISNDWRPYLHGFPRRGSDFGHKNSKIRPAYPSADRRQHLGSGSALDRTRRLGATSPIPGSAPERPWAKSWLEPCKGGPSGVCVGLNQMQRAEWVGCARESLPII